MTLRFSRQVVLIAFLGCAFQACGAPLQLRQGAGRSAGARGAANAPAPGGALAQRFVGNITTRGEVRSDFADYWNQLTPENEGKWASVEATRNQMDWASLDAEVKYARDHGFPFKEHTFVWGRQAPKWLKGLPKKEHDAKQKEIMEQQFPIFWETPQVAGITLWGYVYGATWKPRSGLIKDDTPRPALVWLMDYLHR